jgi:hypothetical protein
MAPRGVRAVLLAVGLLAGCLGSTPALAAELLGALAGSRGQPIAGARISIAGTAVSQSKVTFSGSNGKFYFWGLSPGGYSLTVSYRERDHTRIVSIAEGPNTLTVAIPEP